MAAITILHVSDVHFGERDRQGHQSESCDRLLKKAHQTKVCPDLCIFSGDLTFRGATQEFRSGEAWLKNLIEPWPTCHLFIVPGNHEVARPTGDEAQQTSKCLRSGNNSGLSEEEYTGLRSWLAAGWQNLLSNFSQWHKDARDQQRLPRLVSDWSADLYGCRWDGLIGDLPIRVVGLNTALLSCEDQEQGKLVADLKYCNDALRDLNPQETLSLIVAHHPWTARDSSTRAIEHWLAEWNRKALEQRLLQQTGAHLFLHGHVHRAKGESFSNSLGQHLVVLGAGATHQDQQYPLRFAFYHIDCNNQEITPNTFRFNTHSGYWEDDPSLSNSFRAILPRVGPRYPSSSPHNYFDDFGFDLLGNLHELSKALDTLSKEAYDLTSRYPTNYRLFATAFDKYLQAYTSHIRLSLLDKWQTTKSEMTANIAYLRQHAQNNVLHELIRKLCIEFESLIGQIDTLNELHEHIITYNTRRQEFTVTDYTLYAKIKELKAACDSALTYGISVNRYLVLSHFRVMDT